MRIGDWQGQTVDFDARQIGPVAGYLHRRYINQRTGASVGLSLVFGRPGPVAIHTPDVCYVASGFATASPSKYVLPGSQPPAEFLTAEFVKTRSAEQIHLRTFWSWYAGDSWKVSDTPRFAFAHYPVLYKLHVAREQAAPNEPLDEDPCVEFLQLLLRELQQSVLSPS
jgi:hypothetical protein